jgi:cytoskeletal protein CcmA (bactofilin family)
MIRRLEAERREIEERKREAVEEIERQSRDTVEELEEKLEEARELARERRRDEERRAREMRDDTREQVREVARRARAARSDQKFSLGSTVRVDKGEVASDIFTIAGSIKVDGEVEGSVTALGGDVKINGKVSGNVMAFGDIELGPEADVDGDVTTVGGEVERASGARVGGRVSEARIGSGSSPGNWIQQIGRWDGAPGRWDSTPRWEDWASLFWSLTKLAFLLVVASLAAIIMPRSLDRVAAESVDHLWKSLLMGLAVALLVFPGLVILAVLLVLTIIGIPLVLLFPFLVLFLLLAALFGYGAVAMSAGQWLGQRFGLGIRGRLVAIALGVLAIQGLSLSGDLLDAIGIPFFVHGLFGFSGFVVKTLAWMIGLGAVVSVAMGSRRSAGARLPPLPR